MSSNNELPQVEIPKEVKHRKAKKLPVFVSAEDLTKLLTVSKHKHHKFAYMMGWYSGMRISEILNLEPRDVDMAKGTVFVRQGKGSKDRVTSERVEEIKPIITKEKSVFEKRSKYD